MSLPNPARVEQLTALMAEHGWDRLLFYGNSWRKDFFRYLLNVNFSEPWAMATLTRSGEVHVGQAFLPAAGFQAGLVVAIAGLELMETRFVKSLGITPVSATAQIEELRRVKSTEELDSIRRAADLADRGYEYFAQVIEPGMAEYELVAEVEGFLKSNGAEDNFMLIASGGTEVTGMKPPTERRFQLGDQVTTELTPAINGYYAQICRTLVVGEPNAEQRRAFDIFFEAQRAAEDLLKPGVDIADVARVQNDVFRKYGYGEYTGPKYTRVRGHNLGLHPDENPYVLENVHYAVKEGMVIIAHPNTYLPLSGYMVFGDTLLVTANGCEPLNKAERKLFQK
jgi:Xaa-Pro aminopeptidase